MKLQSGGMRSFAVCFLMCITTVLAQTSLTVHLNESLSSQSNNSSNQVVEENTSPWLSSVYIDAVVCFIILLYVFLGLAIVCDDYLVPAIEVLCDKLDIPEEAAGASFLAFGSAAPEILLNVVGTAYDRVESSLSAILGSAIIAYALIPGLCTIAARPLTLQLLLGPLLRDVGFYVISLAALILFMQDGILTAIECSILSALFIVYMLFIYIPIWMKKDKEIIVLDAPANLTVLSQGIFKEAITPNKPFFSPNFNSPTVGTPDRNKGSSTPLHQNSSTVKASIDKPAYYSQISFEKPNSIQPVLPGNENSPLYEFFLQCTEFISRPYYFVYEHTLPNCQENEPTRKYYPITLILSIVYVALLSQAALVLTRRLSEDLNISQAVSGVTILALGAQIPDTIASVALAKNGHADAAVCNAIGSQVINVTLGSGLPFLVYALVNGFLQIPYENASILSYSLVGVVLCYLVLNLRGLCFSQKKFIGLTVYEGAILLALYIIVNIVLGYTL